MEDFVTSEKDNGMGRSTFLKVTDLNNSGSASEKRNINIYF